jgi:indolepyruvate ferredoxin oxidoreductase
MVIDVDAPRADIDSARAAIDGVTRAADNVYLDAHRLSVSVFGNALPANVIVLGAAWQRGAIPLSLDAIRQAFTLNGVAVAGNLAAFEWGRAVVAAPQVVAAELASPPRAATPGRREQALLDRLAPDDGELRRRLEIRLDDLAGWGGLRAARRYADAVAAIAGLEAERVPGSTAVTEAFAAGLHKLMAYKDEYEVARLHLQTLAELPAGSKVRFMLHPPVLRAMGMDRKLALGGWFVPVLRMLKHGRRLRGTPLDVFGYAGMRRIERGLPGEYTAAVTRALRDADVASLPDVVALAGLPDLVRGYEQIKLDNVERFRTQTTALLAQLDHGRLAQSN